MTPDIIAVLAVRLDAVTAVQQMRVFMRCNG